MLMLGCWLVGVSERGACGFSNERSLTYCASTASCGIAICGSGPPFVIDIADLQPPAGVAGLANTGRRGEQWRRRVGRNLRPPSQSRIAAPKIAALARL